MSFLGNTSDLECEKNEFPRQRPSGIITKVAAHKLSAEPKWTDKREDDSDSEVSSPDNFLTKGAFLLTPSYELSMERAALICEKMAFKGCFSLTKTATGILFKFSHPDDYQAVFKKGFHKVTGARFYRKVSPPTHTHISSDWKGIMGHKLSLTMRMRSSHSPFSLRSPLCDPQIAIPCRPRKTFTLYVLDVPEDLPVEDIRHAMYKFDSVVEVVRLHIYSSLASNAANATSSSAVAASSSSGGGDKGVEGEQIQLLHTPTQTLRRAALRSKVPSNW
ncbi:GD16788 [Drosophila simulans]|uniref:GD16788 n=1 Tax=Drosophila simulans TaxID=7240 RepID=B4R5E2_DROSI|nr:GD16788 [Drosophila simulans]